MTGRAKPAETDDAPRTLPFEGVAIDVPEGWLEALEVRPLETPVEVVEVVPTCDLVEQAVAFSLDGQRYALPLADVQEIQHLVAFSGGATDGAVLGMIDLRGEIVPAVDMRMLFGLPMASFTLETPMVVCRSSRGLVALLVDGVDDVLLLNDECILEPPALHELAPKMLGVARLDSGLVYLLDLNAVLKDVRQEVGSRDA